MTENKKLGLLEWEWTKLFRLQMDMSAHKTPMWKKELKWQQLWFITRTIGKTTLPIMTCHQWWLLFFYKNSDNALRVCFQVDLQACWKNQSFRWNIFSNILIFSSRHLYWCLSYHFSFWNANFMQMLALEIKSHSSSSITSHSQFLVNSSTNQIWLQISSSFIYSNINKKIFSVHSTTSPPLPPLI